MEENKKTALVTGGTRGIGLAIVRQLANEGYDVVFTFSSSEEKAKAIVDELSGNGPSVFSIKADAASFEDTEKVVNYAIEKLGNVGVLVNNAGITKDALLLRMTEEDFDKVIATNLKGVFNYSKLISKHMMKNKYGKVINISSVVGITGNPGQVNYVASKAGVIGFTKSMAKEFGTKNITVNAVAPGFIESDMTSKMNEKAIDAMLGMIPLKRAGKPEDVAKVVSFLASNAANYITGQVIKVDGGMVM